MNAEQHLLDVINAGCQSAGRELHPTQTAAILAALREAIADDPALLEALQGERVAAVADKNADIHRWVKLGRAVEAQSQEEPDRSKSALRQQGWIDCLDAIYTAAGIERP